MKLNSEIELTDFLAAVKAAKGEVWLESAQGDRYNLKSTLSFFALDLKMNLYFISSFLIIQKLCD